MKILTWTKMILVMTVAAGVASLSQAGLSAAQKTPASDAWSEETDINKDGKIDQWIRRDPTGLVTEVALDHNGDGRPDHWVYYQGGKAFKREWDRNKDGKSDLRIIEKDGRFIEKQYDDNFDGTFSRVEKAPLKGSSGLAKNTAKKLIG